MTSSSIMHYRDPRRRRTKRAKNFSEEIIAENFPGFSAETLEAKRKWHDILKVLKRIKRGTENIYPERLSFRIGVSQTNKNYKISSLLSRLYKKY